MEDVQEFESALLKKLEYAGVTRTSLKSIAAEIVKLKKQGLLIDLVYTKGKPGLDRVLINGKIDPNIFTRINDFGRIRRFEIFPYGIIKPEGFGFQGTIGF